MTGGGGVNYIINSLSGKLLRVSWNYLITFKTFIKISMHNIIDNIYLDIQFFNKSITFISFDIPTLIDKDPTMLDKALNDVFKFFYKGVVHVPYLLTVYPIDQAENTFRTIQRGKHHGKIILSFNEEYKAKAPVLYKAKESLKLDPNATFLFISGLGGLDHSLARKFIMSGAYYIAFISQFKDTKPKAKAILEELTAYGAQVKVFYSNITNQAFFLTTIK